MRLSAPRVTPLDDRDWPDEARELLGRTAEQGRVFNIFRTLARYPKLLKRWLPFANHVLFKSSLAPREREILILRIGWLCEAEYEFAQHVAIGRRAGLADADIQRIVDGPDAPGWDPFEAALVRAADELRRDAFVSDATWRALAARYGTEQLMDVVFTVGQYNLVSMALNTLGVPLDPGLEGLRAMAPVREADMDVGVAIFFTDYSMGPAELGRALEARGFESLWAPEHSHIPVSRQTPFPQGGDLPKKYYDVMDPFVTLSAAAAATTRLRLGTGVCLVVQRDPIQTAKQVASLDQVSGGRFLFGIGGGWNAEEMADHGTDFKSRFRVMQERVEAMKAIWTKSRAEYSGEFVRFPPMMTWPKPIQKPHPPVIVGGAYPYGARRALAYGDGWMPHARRPAYGEVLGLLPEFRTLAAEAGRDPATVPVTVFGVAEDLDLIWRYRDAGVARIVFSVAPARADELLPVLDRCATLMRQTGA